MVLELGSRAGVLWSSKQKYQINGDGQYRPRTQKRIYYAQLISQHLPNKFAKRDYTQPSFPNPPLFVERERERERTVEEESSRPCVECEVPRELLLHRSELITPPVLGSE